MPARQQVATDIRLSNVDEMRTHGSLLFAAHKAELEPNAPDLDPDWQAYYELEERGYLQILAAWAEGLTEDHLIGYSVCALFPHLHYKGAIYCHHDILYVAKGHRRSTLGSELIRQTEHAARERGAFCILFHAKPGTSLERLLPRRGYRVEETHYYKEL
jgi:GNAT superfamily N-acetyltransferase